MENQPASPGRPWWVKVALWGISGRGSAWNFVWLSVALGAVCMVYAFWNRLFAAGGLWFFGAIWYLLAIRWVDRHGAW